MKKFFSQFFSSSKKKRSMSQFFETGFHGDLYLIELAKYLLKDTHLFIETGANVGTTLAFVAHNFQHVRCISCEPDLPSFIEAVKHTNTLPNVFIFNETSQQFIDNLHSRFGDLLNSRAVFWLDAHGHGFTWPLLEEVAFITKHFDSAYILIDDFKVPHLDVFNYDQYNGQICSIEYIKPALADDKEYSLYYPSYTERTSTYHPLKGWGFIHYGINVPFSIPLNLQGKMQIGKIP